LPTGDGLLARLMPAAPIRLDAMAGFCDAARQHGNGTIEISARGSLQVRGLTPRAAPLFASAVAELGIAVHEGVPVIAGFDLASRGSTADVAAELRGAMAKVRLALSPKISVVVDGSGELHLDALTADIRLRAGARAPALRFHLGLGGDGVSATWLGSVMQRDVADVVLSILAIIAACGPAARAADVFRTRGAQAFGSILAVIAPTPAPPQRMPAEMIGVHSARDGTVAVGIGFAFGHTTADALAEIVRLATIHGAQAVRPAPDRALLLMGVSPPDALALAAAAQQLGFVVHPGDPRRRIAACPGAPACGSGVIPARALASTLVSLLESMSTGLRRDQAVAAPSALVGEGWGGGSGSCGTALPPPPTPTPDPSPQGGGEELAARLRRELAPAARGIAVHISGCPKGCAHPMPAALTLVGTPQGCGIVHNGSARVAPDHYVDPANLGDEIWRIAAKCKEAAHG